MFHDQTLLNRRSRTKKKKKKTRTKCKKRFPWSSQALDSDSVSSYRPIFYLTKHCMYLKYTTCASDKEKGVRVHCRKYDCSCSVPSPFGFWVVQQLCRNPEAVYLQNSRFHHDLLLTFFLSPLFF